MWHRFQIGIPLLLVMNACIHSNGHNSKVYHQNEPSDPCADTTYSLLLQRIEIKRQEFKTAYLKNQNRTKTIDSCRKYLQTCMADSLFGYWQGTPWAFYGTTEKPQCGDIACGYFVTTLLRDLGFKIPRIRWAKAASETFIREFCNQKVFHHINEIKEDVLEDLETKSGNYYLVGLDTHVGIIEKRNGEINFIHSAEFMEAHGVTREPAANDNPFAVSRYRVFGELFTDLQLTNWILGKSYL